MNDRRDIADLRRILVALDAGEQGLVDLEEAARLAAGLKAELVGLFIEDTELLEVAGLPVARVISRHAGADTALDAALMRRALRVWAARSRESLAAAASHWKVQWSFRVARGTLAEQVLSEAGEFDLLALGRAGGPLREARRRSATHSVTEQARCSVLLLQKGPLAARPVVAIYEGAERPLAVGQALSRVYASRFIVLAVGRDQEAAAALDREASAWLDRQGVKGEVHRLAGVEASQVAEALREQSAGIVVLDRHGGLAPQIEPVLSETDCSVLVLK
jgi:hypothetical protein